MAHAQALTPAEPAVVRLPTEIDAANAGELGERLTSALAPGVTCLVADMTATTFCDSSGISMLVVIHKQAAGQGAEFRVVPSPNVLRVLSITKVDRVLGIYPSLAEALAAPPVPGTADD